MKIKRDTHDLLAGARKVIDCGDLKKHERVVIITDSKQSTRMNKILLDAVNERGGDPIVIVINPITPGGDLPDIVNEALMKSALIITTTSTSVYHSRGIREACLSPNRARLLALSEWTEDTMKAGGITADFRSIMPLAERMSLLLTEGNHIKLTTPAGTDIEGSIVGRKGYANTGIADKPGVKMGLPTIEAFIAPIEKSVSGRIVVDVSCSGGVGIVHDPIYLSVIKGKIAGISGGKEAKKLEKILKDANDVNAYQVAEIAIGLNPQCRVTGNINEDEGKYGTCHIALGNNKGFGGESDPPIHIDMVQWRPELEIDGEKVLICGDNNSNDKCCISTAGVFNGTA